MQGRQTKVDISKHLLGRACLIWDLEIRGCDMHGVISEHAQKSGIGAAAHNNVSNNVTILKKGGNK